MKIREFHFRNLCSYGDKLQKIIFSDNPELILISGKNGNGKTTIANGLIFSLYGQTTKRKIKDLANRFNKHGYTYNKFITSDGRVVEIERNLSPDGYNLKVNGDPKNFSSKPALDEKMEKEYLDIPFEVISNTIILSINDFKSFVKMKKEDKRKIVNKIFPIEKIDRIHEIFKGDVKNATDNLLVIDTSLATQDDLLSKYTQQLNDLEEKFRQEDDILKLQLSEKMKENDSIIISEGFIIDEQNKLVENVEKEVQKSILIIAADKEAMKILEKEIGALEMELSTMVEEAEKNLEPKRLLEVEELNKKYDHAKQKLDNEYINSKKDLDSKHLANISRLKEAISNKKVEIGNELKEKTDFYNKFKSSGKEKIKIDRDSIKSLSESIITNTSELKIMKNDLDIYENDKCPRCKSDLTTDDHTRHKDELKKNMVSLANKIRSDKKEKEIQENNLELYEIEFEKNCKSYEDGISIIRSKIDKIDTLSMEKESSLKDEYTKGLEDIKYIKETGYALISDLYTKSRNEMEDRYREMRSVLILEKKNDYSFRISKKKQELDQISLKIDTETTLKDAKLNNIKKKTEPVIKESEQKITQARTDNNNIKLQLDELNDGKKNKLTLESSRKMVADIKNEISTLTSQKIDVENTLKIYDRVKDAFSEDGVKKMIMSKFIPIFNQTIERLINELGYEFFFSFDEKFDPYITHLGEEVPVESLSSGEEKIMDIIVILAMLELIKYKNPEMNLLFLDEIFNSLDLVNIRKVTELLKRYTIDYNMTIFIISHTPAPMEYFDKILEVTKEDYMSDLSIK